MRDELNSRQITELLAFDDLGPDDRDLLGTLVCQVRNALRGRAELPLTLKEVLSPESSAPDILQPESVGKTVLRTALGASRAANRKS